MSWFKQEKETYVEYPEVVILSPYEKVEAEEYVEDAYDHVYRKKEKREAKKGFESPFWQRLGCFFGGGFCFLAFIFKSIKVMIGFVKAVLHELKDERLHAEIKKDLKQLLNLSILFTGLMIGVINPKIGFWFISLFFSGETLKGFAPA